MPGIGHPSDPEAKSFLLAQSANRLSPQGENTEALGHGFFGASSRHRHNIVSVRGAVLTRVSGSSLARVHRVFLPEPTHMEVEDEDQENELEDERDGEECRVESRRVSRQHTMRMKHG